MASKVRTRVVRLSERELRLVRAARRQMESARRSSRHAEITARLRFLESEASSLRQQIIELDALNESKQASAMLEADGVPMVVGDGQKS